MYCNNEQINNQMIICEETDTEVKNHLVTYFFNVLPC